MRRQATRHGLRRDIIAHLGTLDFAAAKRRGVPRPAGTGKTHLAVGLAIRACQAGHRVLFATASECVARLADAHHAGRLQAELTRLGRYPLLVIDEVGYIPFEPEADRDHHVGGLAGRQETGTWLGLPGRGINVWW